MQWVNLTSSALEEAMRAGLPAVLPLGSIEAHSDHLPLGNDTFSIERTCIRAAETEAAVVLPPPLIFVWPGRKRSAAIPHMPPQKKEKNSSIAASIH